MREVKEMQKERESLLRAYMLNMIDYDDARLAINNLTREIEKVTLATVGIVSDGMLAYGNSIGISKMRDMKK